MVIPLAYAKKIALKSDCQHRHSALIFRGGSLLAAGFNHDDIHAEAWAISKLWPSKRAGTTLFSYRLTRGGKVGLAKPCINCTHIIREAGIKKVYYTLDDGTIATLTLKRNLNAN